MTAAAGLVLSLLCSSTHSGLRACWSNPRSSAIVVSPLVSSGRVVPRRDARSVALPPVMSTAEPRVGTGHLGRVEEAATAGVGVEGLQATRLGSVSSPVTDKNDCSADGAADTAASGKSTLACSLSRELYHRGFLSYVLDGDNVRHGLNKDLSFNPEDRAENIRRIREVAKLFADAGVICIAGLISPYRRDRDACRALLPEATFIEVFMDIPLEVCEARDPKGLYKLARAGKIKGFTGIDDPYEPPLNCEIVIQQKDDLCPSPAAMAEQVMLYLELNGYLQAV